MTIFKESFFYRATLPVKDVESSNVHNATCEIHTISNSSPASDNSALNGSPRRHSSVDEIFGLINSMSVNGQRQRSLSDSGRKDKSKVNGWC